jgi:hypothetical protein
VPPSGSRFIVQATTKGLTTPIEEREEVIALALPRKRKSEDDAISPRASLDRTWPRGDADPAVPAASRPQRGLIRDWEARRREY